MRLRKQVLTEKLTKQAVAEVGQAQPQLGLKLNNVEIWDWNENLSKC